MVGMVQFAIFDMDQTLVDAHKTHDAAMVATLRETFGIDGSYDDLPGKGAGVRISVSITEIAMKKGVPTEVAVAKAKEALTRYEEHFVHGLPMSESPLPGALKLLKALREQGVKLGLVTGSPERIAKALLHAAGLEGFFEVAVYGEEAQTRDQLVHRALEKAGIPAAETMAVGDSIHDIDAGRANRVRVIAVTTGNYTRDQLAAHKADLVVDTLADPRVREVLS